ncbi:MAG: hypothetical protein DLM59_19090 [Pseudonocardiales bacterium]|nr:MAG: hypothetical protein DLM59_19090 [Pseudonocardiales bacterium]
MSGTGEQGNHAGGEDAGSHTPTISADGRYVSFVSFASNLVPADTNGRTDVFLRDWRAGVTRRISYSGAGAQADGDSSFNSISPDGRYVAFSSAASNLVPADTNAHVDVFVRDWVAGTTRRISVSGTGAQGNDDSPYGTISSGGRYVAFRSSASNLIPGDTNGCADIFVRVTG